ncbi:MAG: hypothetical protein ACKOF9_08100, partial [Burkholderiales bacterium]
TDPRAGPGLRAQRLTIGLPTTSDRFAISGCKLNLIFVRWQLGSRIQVKGFAILGLVTASMSSNAADSSLLGNLIDTTSTPAGLLVRLDAGIPTNCTGTPYGWMLIKAENKTMIAVVLTMFAMGKKGATVYTNPKLPGEFCEITQYDPVE